MGTGVRVVVSWMERTDTRLAIRDRGQPCQATEGTSEERARKSEGQSD